MLDAMSLSSSLLVDVEIDDAGAESGDQVLDRLVVERFVDARFLDADNLATKRQNGLCPSIASLLGGSACGVTLDQEDLALHLRGSRSEQSGELAGQVRRHRAGLGRRRA